MAVITTIIMAGGLGTRMRSPHPKVLADVCGLPMLAWVASAAREAGAEDVIVVASPDTAGAISEAIPDIRVAVQEPANGTGHAVMVGLELVSPETKNVVVLSGDTPAIRSQTIRRTIDAQNGAAAALVSARLAPPHAYGRVVRSHDVVARIVEARDASDVELAIAEFNVGLYCFDRVALEDALPRLTSHNAQGELYLTDTVAVLAELGLRVLAVDEPDFQTCEGVNTLLELSEREAAMRRRHARELMLAGVRILDPASTLIDPSVTIEAGARIEPFSSLRGTTRIAAGAVIGPYTLIESSSVGEGCRVGPFAYLRPGCRLEQRAQVGRFVELKSTTLHEGAKVPHLSYIGDAEVGAGTNLGASTITANYDGVSKHKTVIGAGVRTSVHSTLVAPVTIGDGAIVAAGSVITDDVEPGALAIARSRQSSVPGYAERKRKEREQ